ncbi:MAG: VWA domain-containing protein [Chloroflexi bacterium]|nr:VWA domain-containing protein [Chloroflexota bacterium]MBU1751299.1 VWA domain-containing protein [Chloroflexota bacterium]
MKKLVAPLVALIMLAVIATPAAADGIVVPREVTAPPLAIKYHRVQVQITDQVASTNVDQVFVNDWNQECEGTYIFPIPESAAISDFTMEVDGKTLEGRLLDKDEARRIYESIVRQRQDPALLEYVGRNAFQASVYPIPPHGERRIQIGYNEILRADGDMIYYRYPLNTEKFSARPIEDVSVVVRVQASRDIQAVYSPSHDIATHRIDARTVEVNYETRNESPDKDFELYYVLGEGAISTSLMTYRDLDGEGFFLLLLAPPPTEPTAVVDKDVIFILDTSGSMRGEKLAQAQSALRFILDNLNPGDRFNIVSFNSSVSAYAEGLVAAAQAGDARRYVDRLQATGGTNIDGALTAALKLTDEDSSRPQVLIFLTDGLPTVGERSAERIIANVQDRAPAGVRLFAWGVGDDVNTVLLDTISLEQHGTCDYVRPGEDLEVKVSSFYTKIQSPVLADVALSFDGVTAYDIYPAPLPDLFAGGQLVVTGRFRGRAPADIVLRGQVNGAPMTYTWRDMPFSTGDNSPDFVPRLWATRKVGSLMSQIRLHGSEKELIDEIVALSLRYGIITPYTSFLVEEDAQVFTEEGRKEAEQRMYYAPAAQPTAGAGAVDYSQSNKGLRESDRSTGPSVQQVRHVGNRTFILQDGVWTDSLYQESMTVKTIAFDSTNYYDILAQRPDWGPYFALGKSVIVVEGGVAYRVAEGDGSASPAVTVPVQPTPPAASSPVAPPQPAADPLAQFLSWLRGLLP